MTTREEAERIAETDDVASAIGYLVDSHSVNAAVDLVLAVMSEVSRNRNHFGDANKKVSIDLSYLRELEDHLNRFDGLQKAAEDVYDEFQKRIAHGDNGAQLLEALHRLHVELHK